MSNLGKLKRDQIHKGVTKLYYNVLCLENMSEKISKRWGYVIRALNFMLIITLLSIFALSQEENLHIHKGYISIFGVFLTLLQFFSISDKLCLWQSVNKELKKLRSEIDISKNEIEQDYEFNTTLYNKLLYSLSVRYSLANSDFCITDIFYTEGLRKYAENEAQKQLCSGQTKTKTAAKTKTS